MSDYKIELIKSENEHLDILYKFQTDKEANYLAAFTAKDPNDKSAYVAKYSKLLADPTINNRTILVNGQVAGSIAKFLIQNDAEITYWIAKEFWGKGIASKALNLFLEIEQTRPLFARAAFDNYRSQKVLENNNFEKVGSDSGFAEARQEEIVEFIYKLSQ
jgi:RimJ/RimL family protein N-acetyltransferase